MGVVVSFVDYRPPVRFDSNPWASVRIEEAASWDGSYAELETLALDPVDVDPAEPALRSFTTQLGTALDYWYRIAFVDADGDESQVTVPVQNSALAETPAVRAYATTDELARILRLRQPSDAQVTALQRVLDAAALEIDREVGLSEPYEQAPALAVEVNLERAVEHWQQQESPFGVIGLGESVPTVTAKDTWDRHANKLVPLKLEWGIA